MDAPLCVYPKDEQRAVVRYLWSESVSDSDIHGRLLTHYGDSALLRKSIYACREKFKSAGKSVTYEEGTGHPSNSTTDENIQPARKRVRVNRRYHRWVNMFPDESDHRLVLAFLMCTYKIIFLTSSQSVEIGSSQSFISCFLFSIQFPVPSKDF